MPSRLLGLTTFFCFTLFTPCFKANAQDAAPPDRLNLAFVLPKPSPNHTESISITDRDTYDVGVVAVGSLVAADDKGLYRTVQGPNGPSPAERKVANGFSELASFPVLPVLIGGAYLVGDHGTRDTAWRAGLAVTRASIIGLVLKSAIGRERPQGAQGGSSTTFHPATVNSHYDSFPSGHTLAAFAAASVWAGKNPSERYIAYGLASAVGASRIVKGAHWPSDVFWGAVIGISQGRQALKGNANLLNIRF